MGVQNQAKRDFIQAMRDLYPDNASVQQSADTAENDTFEGLVNTS